MGYTVEKNALRDGTLHENYEFLFSNENKTKTRFIREYLPVLVEYGYASNTIVEFGVDAVNSTWAFLSCLPQKLISVDITNKKAPSILALAEELAKENEIDFEFWETSTLECVIPECDLLFIDTEHTYKQLKAELELHASKVKKYIILHDTVQFKGVKQAMDEFLKLNDSWVLEKNFLSKPGLAVLKRL